MLRTQQIRSADMIQKLQQRIKKTANIEQTNRLLVKAKLQPRKRLKEFIQRTKATGQSYKAITEVNHHLLALMHTARDTKLRAALMAQLFRKQGLGNNAYDLATRRKRRIRHSSHKTYIATAIDDADPLRY